MKAQIFLLIRLVACSVFAFAISSSAAETNTNASAGPKSTFNSSLDSGRDPFFPESTRRNAPKNTGTNKPQPPPASSQLSLKGIVNKPSGRLALINNQTFGVGEELTVRTSVGQVRVRCLEIRERSVLISVEGDSQPKELHLRENF